MGLFKKKTLSGHLKSTKKVKVNGILFEIKKISVIDHVRGAKVLQQVYDTYSVGKEDSKSKLNDEREIKKIKDVYTDILESGVVKPKLSRKESEGCILIEEVLSDWGLSELIVSEILDYTYGKKKEM